MKSFGRLFSRSRKYSSKTARQARRPRRLRSETLERRQLLAGDILAHHNYLVSQDVNRDFEINPTDALTVINAMNRYGSGSTDRLPLGEGSSYVDVNADDQLTPIDALQVINALNRGEGVGELLELRLDVREHFNTAVDPNDPGNPPIDPSLLPAGSRELTVSVGDIVDLEISYEDQRGGLTSDDIGAFTIFADLLTTTPGVTFSDYVEPVLTETQDLIFSSDLAQAEGGNLLVSLEGSSEPPISIPASSLQTESPVELISGALRTAGFTETAEDGVTELDQFQVRQLPSSGDADAPFEFRIRFLGDALANTQIPNIVVDVSGVTSTAPGFDLTFDLIEIPAVNPDGSVNSNALPFNINTFSRTYFGPRGVNSRFYNLSNGGDFTSDGFDEVGGVGQVLTNGIDPLPEPFDAFSLPVRFVQPIDNFVIQLDPPDTSAAAITLYPGNDGDILGPDQIEIDTTDDPISAEDDRFGLVVFNAVEGPVVASPGSITLNEDLDPPGGNSIDLLPLVEDIEDPNATLTITSVSDGTIGTVSLNGSVATYVPAEDANGPDSFTYTATNGTDSATGTISVAVNPINDPPAAGDDTLNGTQDIVRLIQPSELLGNDNGGPADEDQTLTITSVSPLAGTDPTLGSVVLNNDGTVSYTPPAGFFGTDRFQYTVEDSGGLTDTAVVTIEIAEVNTPPVVNDDTLTTPEDTPLTFTEADLLANDTDNGVINLVSLDENLDPATEGTITDQGDGSFTYAPPENVFGTGLASFTYTVSDGEFQETATVTVDVTPVNDPPVATDDSLTADELTTNTLDVLANDNAGPGDLDQTLTITAINTTGTSGTASIINNGQNISFTPAGLAPDTTSLSYTIEDSEGLSATATVNISVVPAIRPRAVGDSDTAAEDSGVINLDVLANDLPNLGEEATLETVSSPLEGDAIVAINDGGTPGDKTDDTIDVAPADDFFGPISFTYAISDTAGVVNDPAVATATVTINITPVNDPPEFVPDPLVTTPEDTPRTIDGNGLLANDNVGADNETDQSLAITGVTATSDQGGTVSLDGSDLIYTPPLNYNGPDQITYTIADGDGPAAETTTGTLNLSVTPVNDPPTPGAPSLSGTEDTQQTLPESQLLNGSLAGPTTGTPEAGQTLSVTGLVSATSEAGGTLSLDNDGNVTYNPPQDFNGDDSFVISISDDGMPVASANVTVSLDIAAVNDPPVAQDDSLVAFQNVVATFTQSQLTANDVPGPDNESDQTLKVLAVNALPGPGIQSVSLNSDGTIRFEPVTDFEGNAQFEYTVSDGELTTTAIATVEVQKFQPSRIAGSVFFDNIESLVNPVRNGVQDLGEAGLSGVTVTVSSGAADNVTGVAIARSTLTEVDGGFAFDNLPPGQFTVNLDVPPMVMDGPDFAGTQGDADAVANQFTLGIPQPGGVQAVDYRFTMLGLMGAASETGTILAIDYLNENPDTAADSDFGRQGGSAALNPDGSMSFFKGREGLDDARFIEVALNGDQDEALLSYIDKATGVVRTARLDANQFLVVPDGNGGAVVRVFGGLEDFDFADSPEQLLEQEFGNYRDAIDQIMGGQG